MDIFDLLVKQSDCGREPNPKLSTKQVVERLNANEDRDYSLQNYKEGINSRWLYKKLKGFGIVSKNVRVSSSAVVKGFDYAQCADAFERYLGKTLRSALTLDDDESEEL